MTDVPKRIPPELPVVVGAVFGFWVAVVLLVAWGIWEVFA